LYGEKWGETKDRDAQEKEPNKDKLLDIMEQA
jgi:hypothetical protein